MAVAAVLIGCASTETAQKEPTLRQDFIEYRQIVVLAMNQVDTTLRALDEISVQANRDPRPAYQAFAKAVHRLEVDSIKVRARTQAMRARGDAYFEHWEAYLAGVKNEQVRQLAEEHRPELKRSFEQAQQASQQVREVFRPFLSDLQKLRAVLEADPTLARIDAAEGSDPGSQGQRAAGAARPGPRPGRDELDDGIAEAARDSRQPLTLCPCSMIPHFMRLFPNSKPRESKNQNRPMKSISRKLALPLGLGLLVSLAVLWASVNYAQAQWPLAAPTTPMAQRNAMNLVRQPGELVSERDPDRLFLQRRRLRAVGAAVSGRARSIWRVQEHVEPAAVELRRQPTGRAGFRPGHHPGGLH